MTPEIDSLEARAARLAAQVEALADALHTGVVPSMPEALESLGSLRDDVLRYAEALGAGACTDLRTLRAATERVSELANALSRIVPVDAETAAELNATRARILDRDQLMPEHLDAAEALVDLIAGATTLPGAEYDLRESRVDEAFGRKIRQAAVRGLLRLSESASEAVPAARPAQVSLSDTAAVGSTADAVRREQAQPEVNEPRRRASRPAVAIAGGALLILVVLAALFTSRLVTHGSKRAAALAPTAASTAAAAGGVATTASAVGPAFALCGSNTIGARLAPDLVRGFLSSEQAHDVSATPALNDKQNVLATLNDRLLWVHIAALGSASAFTGLRSGKCQIGMAGRRITPDEAAGLRSLGNMFAPASEHVIGLDGIAVIVNPANAAWSLSVAQLKDVFSGKATSWQQLAGGSAASIDVFAHDERSETYDTFKSVVLEKMALADSARRFADGASLSAAVAADPNAIGFVDRRYISDAKALRLSSGGSPVAPSPENIGRETYPLTRRLFMYTAASPQNAMVTKFIRFVQSDAGQKIVNQDGFVGTDGSLRSSPSAAPTSVGAAEPIYQSLLSSFDQAGFNLSFDSGAATLGSKALVDVARLVTVVSSRANKQVATASSRSTSSPTAA